MTNVAQSQVWRILHNDGFYLYHLQRIQHFLPGDHIRCAQFFEWLQTQLQILPVFLFTDEAKFTSDSITNTRSLHSWAQENPHQVIQFFNSDFQLTCGVKYEAINNLFRPHVYQGMINSFILQKVSGK